MNEILKTTFEELIFEGRKGTTLQNLFIRMQEKQLPMPFSFELQRWLVSKLLSHKNIIHMVTIQTIANLSAQEFKYFLSTTTIKATAEAIEKRIRNKTETFLTETVLEILIFIATKRSQGVHVTTISQHFDKDPRTTFHFIKTLLQSGLVVKIPVFINSQTTNLIVYSQFKAQCEIWRTYIGTKYAPVHIDLSLMVGESRDTSADIDLDSSNNQFNLDPIERAVIDQNILVDNNFKQFDIHIQGDLESNQSSTLRFNSVFVKTILSQILLQTPNKICRKEDFIKKLKITKKVHKKSLNRILTQLRSDKYIEIIKVKLNGKWDLCIRMLKSFEEVLDVKETLYQNMYTKFGILHQIYRMIVQSGENGLVKRDITLRLPQIQPKTIIRLLDEKLVRMKRNGKVIIRSIMENIKSIRQARYFAVYSEDIIYKELKSFKDLGVEHVEVLENWVLDNICNMCKKYTLTLHVSKNEKQYCSEVCMKMDSSDYKPKTLMETVNFSRREQYLREIMRRYQVVRVGKTLGNAWLISGQAFDQIAVEIDPQVQSYLIDTKIATKICNKLAAQGEIKLVDVGLESLSGARKQVSIACLPDVDVTSPVFKDYVSKQQREFDFKPQQEVNIPKFEDIEVMSIERINANINLGMSDSCGVSKSRDISEADREEDTDSGSDLDDADIAINVEESPADIAEKLGYLRPTNQRAQMFHLWLYELSSNLVPDYYIDTLRAMRLMPLSLYLRVIGATQNTDPPLVDPEIQSTPIHELDLKLRICLTKNLKRDFFKLVGYLYEQELISIHEYNSESKEYFEKEYVRNKDPHFIKIKRNVPFYDFSTEPLVKIDDILMPTLKEAEGYWSRLEHTCIHAATGEHRLDIRKITKKYQRLYRNSSWRRYFSYSAEKKRLMNNYIDPKTGNTPLENDLLCVSIGNRIGLTVTQVKAYYKKMKARYFRFLSLKTNEEVKKLKPIKKRKEISVGRRPRKSWNSLEDDLILCGHVLINQFSDNFLVQQNVLFDFFKDEDLSRDQVRNRLKVLKGDLTSSNRILRLKSLFGAFMESYGEIDASSVINDAKNISIAFHNFSKTQEDVVLVQYFIPDTLDEFLNQFNVEEFEDPDFVTLIDKQTSKAARLTVLNQHPLIYNIFGVQQVDFPIFTWRPEDLGINTVVKLLKMMQLTPDLEYSPEIAWKSIQMYPEQTLHEAIHKLSLLGSVAQFKNAQKVTGKGFKMTELFMNTLSSFFGSKLFPQAMRFWKKYEADKGCVIEDYKDQGTMCILIEMLDDEHVEWVMSESVEEDMHNFKLINSPSFVEDTVVLPNEKRTRNEPEPQGGKRQRTDKTKINAEVDDDLYEYILMGDANGRSIQEVKKSHNPNQLPALISAKRVFKVGFDHYRYVADKYFPFWTLKIESPESFSPKIWTTMSGTISPLILRKSTESVLSLIVKKPGIYESNIYKAVKSIVSRIELRELLESLVTAKVVERLCLEIKEGVNDVFDNIFESSVRLKEVDYDDLNEFLICSYVPVDGWITKFLKMQGQ